MNLEPIIFKLLNLKWPICDQILNSLSNYIYFCSIFDFILIIFPI